jgi:hypothetical protein
LLLELPWRRLALNSLLAMLMIAFMSARRAQGAKCLLSGGLCDKLWRWRMVFHLSANSAHEKW